MVKRSCKYEGLLWRKTLKVIKRCLYKTRCLTGSLMSAGVICSNLPAHSTTRANVFCTRCSFLKLQSVVPTGSECRARRIVNVTQEIYCFAYIDLKSNFVKFSSALLG